MLIVVCAEVNPEAMAVMVAEPGAWLARLARACVWPPFMVTDAGTDAIVLFDEDKVTVTPSSGAFAGVLLASCS